MSRRTARRGFTLLEISIVLAISAIAALLVLPQWTEPSDIEADAPARIAAWLAEARHQAIGARQTVTVYLDAGAARVRMDTSGASGSGVWRDEPLPRELLASFEPADLRRTIEFHRTGAAFGEPVQVRTRDGIAQLTIDRWSGEVHRVAR